jgi:hypothetical protein
VEAKRSSRCSCVSAASSELYAACCRPPVAASSCTSHSRRRRSATLLLAEWPRHTRCICLAALSVSRSRCRCARSCCARSRAACDPAPEPGGPKGFDFLPPRLTWRAFRVLPVKFVNMVVARRLQKLDAGCLSGSSRRLYCKPFLTESHEFCLRRHPRSCIRLDFHTRGGAVEWSEWLSRWLERLLQAAGLY